MSEQDPAAEEVRRLLADARATEPMPADVNARLEGVLNDLSSDRAAEAAEAATPAVVVDLASRRRSRAKTLLIAAAAVTVFGLAAPQLFSGGSGQMDAGSDSAADTAAESDAADQESGSGALEDNAEAPAENAPESSSDSADADAVPAKVRPGTFVADAEAARDQAARTDLTGSTALDANCLVGADLAEVIDQLQSIPVRYGDLDAALVLSKARNGSQRATLYVCGESSPRRTAKLSPR